MQRTVIFHSPIISRLLRLDSTSRIFMNFPSFFLQKKTISTSSLSVGLTRKRPRSGTKDLRFTTSSGPSSLVSMSRENPREYAWKWDWYIQCIIYHYQKTHAHTHTYLYIYTYLYIRDYVYTYIYTWVDLGIYKWILLDINFGYDVRHISRIMIYNWMTSEMDITRQFSMEFSAGPLNQ